MRLQRHGEAAESYARAIELDPGDARARTDRGYALVALGRPADALGSFGGAIRIDAGARAAHVGRATALMALGRSGDALEALGALGAEAMRGDPSAQLVRAAALGNLGRGDEAMEALNSAVSLDPESGLLRRQRSRALRILGRDSGGGAGPGGPPYPARGESFEN